MSKIHKETKEIYGELYTQFGTFKMLSLHPNKHSVPYVLKEVGFLEFYVVDADGFGKNVWVCSKNTLIKPLSEKGIMVVNFLLDDDTEQVDN